MDIDSLTVDSLVAAVRHAHVAPIVKAATIIATAWIAVEVIMGLIGVAFMVWLWRRSR